MPQGSSTPVYISLKTPSAGVALPTSGTNTIMLALLLNKKPITTH